MGDLTEITDALGIFSILDAVGIVCTAIVGVFGVVGLFLCLHSRAKRLVSWPAVENAIRHILRQMTRDQYAPDAIFSAGRGGAVIAALMSNKFFGDHAVPIFMVDRQYEHSKQGRTPTLRTDVLELRDPPKRVLLVAGINASGKSIGAYVDWLKSHGCEEVLVAVLLENKSSSCKADYVYRRRNIDVRKLNFPWYRGGIIDWVPREYQGWQANGS